MGAAPTRVGRALPGLYRTGPTVGVLLEINGCAGEVGVACGDNIGVECAGASMVVAEPRVDQYQPRMRSSSAQGEPFSGKEQVWVGQSAAVRLGLAFIQREDLRPASSGAEGARRDPGQRVVDPVVRCANHHGGYALSDGCLRDGLHRQGRDDLAVPADGLGNPGSGDRGAAVAKQWLCHHKGRDFEGVFEVNDAPALGRYLREV